MRYAAHPYMRYVSIAAMVLVALGLSSRTNYETLLVPSMLIGVTLAAQPQNIIRLGIIGMVRFWTACCMALAASGWANYPTSANLSSQEKSDFLLWASIALLFAGVTGLPVPMILTNLLAIPIGPFIAVLSVAFAVCFYPVSVQLVSLSRIFLSIFFDFLAVFDTPLPQVLFVIHE